MSSRAATAASCSASRPSSPASRPATRVSSEVKSRWARSARATASSRARPSRPTSSSAAAARDLQRVDLAVQPGQALAPVGGGALQAGDPAVLLGGGVLGGTAGGDGLLERGAVGVDLGGDPLLLLADLLGLGLELVGVAPGARLLGVGGAGGVADPLGGQRLGAAQPLAQPGQREPGLLGRGPARAGPRAAPPRGAASVSRACGDLGLDLLAARDQDRLVGHLLLQRGARGDQVVGQQPGAGVADVGLHGRGPAGHLGLPAERLELAPDLGEQVVEPGQVALGGVELAERLLLALAVLEDAGGLLDEAAPVLGGRVQDRVELALADDHVHLAADAGVGQQLLDVEQPARVAVDGVLGAAAAEHGAADRDLGVLDRQRAVGVVDGQHAPRRGPAAAGPTCRRR